VLLRLLRVLAAAATVVACSTALNISGDPNDLPPGREGGPGGEGGNDTDASAPACSLVVDRETIDFGESLLNENQKETLTLRSFSSAPAPVKIVVTGSGFDVQQKTVDVPAMGTQAVTVTYSAGSAARQPQGSVTFEYGGGCPLKTTLSAHTVATGFAVSPGTLDLGSRPCGVDPPDGNIIVKAGGPATWQAAWETTPPGTPFSLPVSSGQLVIGTNSILVQATPIEPASNPRLETRTAIVSFPGTTEAARNVVVTTKSLGASLALNKSALLLSTADRFGFVTLTNKGNEPVTVSLNIGLPFSIDAANNLTIFPGTPKTFIVEYVGENSGDQMLSIVAVTGTICAQEPLRVRTTTAF
jgi:hypothetical protein